MGEPTLREEIAAFLWERFAPSHVLEFSEDSQRSEYLAIADGLLALLDRRVPTLRPGGSGDE